MRGAAASMGVKRILTSGADEVGVDRRDASAARDPLVAVMGIAHLAMRRALDGIHGVDSTRTALRNPAETAAP
jgi:hypothetical protein